MTKIQYEGVDLLLVDADMNARQSTKIMLQNNGFRNIGLGISLATVREVLSKHMPDILLSESIHVRQ